MSEAALDLSKDSTGLAGLSETTLTTWMSSRVVAVLAERQNADASMS